MTDTTGDLDAAIILATKAHAGQYDLADAPYIFHPLRVMLRCQHTIERIVAVLHDVVEDCDVSLEAIRERFGDEVAAAVGAITRLKGESYAQYVERLKRNDVAKRVKLYDTEDNLAAWRITTKNHKRIALDRHAKLYAELKEELMK